MVDAAVFELVLGGKITSYKHHTSCNLNQTPERGCSAART
eukprot:SAG25_NODE_515_length_7274_cov_3.113031_2_plen_40_part_00